MGAGTVGFTRPAEKKHEMDPRLRQRASAMMELRAVTLSEPGSDDICQPAGFHTDVI